MLAIGMPLGGEVRAMTAADQLGLPRWGLAHRSDGL